MILLNFTATYPKSSWRLKKRYKKLILKNNLQKYNFLFYKNFFLKNLLVEHLHKKFNKRGKKDRSYILLLNSFFFLKKFFLKKPFIIWRFNLYKKFKSNYFFLILSNKKSFYNFHFSLLKTNTFFKKKKNNKIFKFLLFKKLKIKNSFLYLDLIISNYCFFIKILFIIYYFSVFLLFYLYVYFVLLIKLEFFFINLNKKNNFSFCFFFYKVKNVGLKLKDIFWQFSLEKFINLFSKNKLIKFNLKKKNIVLPFYYATKFTTNFFFLNKLRFFLNYYFWFCFKFFFFFKFFFKFFFFLNFFKYLTLNFFFFKFYLNIFTFVTVNEIFNVYANSIVYFYLFFNFNLNSFFLKYYENKKTKIGNKSILTLPKKNFNFFSYSGILYFFKFKKIKKRIFKKKKNNYISRILVLKYYLDINLFFIFQDIINLFKPKYYKEIRKKMGKNSKKLISNWPYQTKTLTLSIFSLKFFLHNLNTSRLDKLKKNKDWLLFKWFLKIFKNSHSIFKVYHQYNHDIANRTKFLTHFRW